MYWSSVPSHASCTVGVLATAQSLTGHIQKADCAHAFVCVCVRVCEREGADVCVCVSRQAVGMHMARQLQSMPAWERNQTIQQELSRGACV